MMMQLNCPNCGSETKVMVVTGADESVSGLTERLHHCEHCDSDWESTTDDATGAVKVKRYFFG